MTTDQLESFIKVAENLNFARAAESLQITQSAVSRQIHALEDELGVKLLHRTTRSVTLTPAGVSFLEDAKQVVGRLSSAKQKLHRQDSSPMQLLTIGCPSEENLPLLEQILKRCRKELPQLYPFLKIIPHRSLLTLFYRGDLDLLFGFQDDIPQKGDMVYRELFRLPLCCLLASDHPLADREELSLDDLLSEKVIVCNSYAIPSGAAEIQDKLARQLPPDSCYFCENLQVLLTLIKAGYGCSVLPQNTNYANAEIIQIPLKDSPLLSYGIFSGKDPKEGPVRDFLSLCSHLN